MSSNDRTHVWSPPRSRGRLIDGSKETTLLRSDRKAQSERPGSASRRPYVSTPVRRSLYNAERKREQSRAGRHVIVVAEQQGRPTYRTLSVLPRSTRGERQTRRPPQARLDSSRLAKTACGENWASRCECLVLDHVLEIRTRNIPGRPLECTTHASGYVVLTQEPEFRFPSTTLTISGVAARPSVAISYKPVWLLAASA